MPDKKPAAPGGGGSGGAAKKRPASGSSPDGRAKKNARAGSPSGKPAKKNSPSGPARPSEPLAGAKGAKPGPTAVRYGEFLRKLKQPMDRLHQFPLLRARTYMTKNSRAINISRLQNAQQEIQVNYQEAVRLYTLFNSYPLILEMNKKIAQQFIGQGVEVEHSQNPLITGRDAQFGHFREFINKVFTDLAADISTHLRIFGYVVWYKDRLPGLPYDIPRIAPVGSYRITKRCREGTVRYEYNVHPVNAGENSAFAPPMIGAMGLGEARMQKLFVTIHDKYEPDITGGHRSLMASVATDLLLIQEFVEYAILGDRNKALPESYLQDLPDKARGTQQGFTDTLNRPQHMDQQQFQRVQYDAEDVDRIRKQARRIREQHMTQHVNNIGGPGLAHQLNGMVSMEAMLPLPANKTLVTPPIPPSRADVLSFKDREDNIISYLFGYPLSYFKNDSSTHLPDRDMMEQTLQDTIKEEQTAVRDMLADIYYELYGRQKSGSGEAPGAGAGDGAGGGRNFAHYGRVNFKFRTRPTTTMLNLDDFYDKGFLSAENYALLKCEYMGLDTRMVIIDPERLNWERQYLKTQLMPPKPEPGQAGGGKSGGGKSGGGGGGGGGGSGGKSGGGGGAKPGTGGTTEIPIVVSVRPPTVSGGGGGGSSSQKKDKNKGATNKTKPTAKTKAANKKSAK